MKKTQWDEVVLKYRSDFIIRLRNNKMLVFETKGQETHKDKEKRKLCRNGLGQLIRTVHSVSGTVMFLITLQMLTGLLKGIVDCNFTKHLLEASDIVKSGIAYI